MPDGRVRTARPAARRSSPVPPPGIGAETAKALAAAGHPVALGARRVDRCEELAAAIRADGGEAVAHPLDVTDDESVADFAAKAAADLGDVEVVVSNAGADRPGRAARDHRRAARATRSTSTCSARTGWSAPSCPAMVERQRGDIVFVSSDVAVRPRPFMGGYSATQVGARRPGRRRSRWSSRAPASGRRSCAPARPGARWAWTGTPTRRRFVLNQWVKWGLARHSALPQGPRHRATRSRRSSAHRAASTSALSTSTPKPRWRKP